MRQRNTVLAQSGVALRLLESAARHARIVVFCGIPGVGKSLFLREQHSLALLAGRRVHRLEWDVARQAFEQSTILSRYPEIDGSTHVMIRRAIGIWSRAAIQRWSECHAGQRDMLLIEAPLVGARLIEIAQVIDDGAEPLLSAQETQFFVPTPTRQVRLAIEAARRAESTANRHLRDAANASPRVVDELWRNVAVTAERLGLVSPDVTSSYSPTTYYAVYEAVLRHRHASQIPIETIIEDPGSPHVMGSPIEELVPLPTEALELLARAEAEGAEPIAERATRWYLS
jgi:hypothetical protein